MIFIQITQIWGLGFLELASEYTLQNRNSINEQLQTINLIPKVALKDLAVSPMRLRVAQDLKGTHASLYDLEFPNFDRFELPRETFLIVDGHWSCQTDAFERITEHLSPDHEYRLGSIAGLVHAALESEIRLLQVAANLAAPGGMALSGGVGAACINGRQVLISKFEDSFFAIDEEFENARWPALGSFPLKRAIYFLREQPGVLAGQSTTPVSTAAAAFTRLFNSSHRRDDVSEFVWALAGLEALLCDGREGNAKQIQGKLEALYPPSDAVKRVDLQKLRNMRNELVHGGAGIKSAIVSAVGNRAISAEVFECAIQCFTSTLQYVAQTEASELKFAYRLEG